MLVGTAVFLVLLHLHASDTLREDSRKGKSAIQIPDEDLLDLMVRIAESPAEWEKVHRVLSLLGNENHKTKEDKPVTTAESNYSVTHSNNNTVQPINKTKTNPSTKKTLLKHLDYQTEITTRQPVETDTGWPDFNEAIYKQVKKTTYEDNDVLESEWLEKEWFETYWSDYLNAQKDHQTILQDSFRKDEAVSFVPVRETQQYEKAVFNKPENTISNGSKDLLSVSNDNLLFDSQQNVSNISLEESKGGVKPVFLYHRVTLGPQEKKGSNAFIAVSVVKQTNIDSPVTTLPPPTRNELPDRDNWRLLYRIEESSTTEKDQRNNKQHRKGQRRHHSHTHTHTHSHH